MSTSIENLRRLAGIDVGDHIALFDFYVVSGRDIEYLAIRFGTDPQDIINLLEGYGEKVMKDGAVDQTERGRFPNLSRHYVEEYIRHFYPGIASENPQNDWIRIEAFLDIRHPGWRQK